MDYKRSEAKEASRAQFHGAWAAITTPFTPDGDMDEAGLRANMRHYTDVLHVDGVFCTGIMGEFWSLTKEERLRAVEVVVEEARGKCKVIAHTAHHSAAETVELTRHAQEVGADFAILINPYFPAVPRDAMVVRWFEDVCSKVDIGVWMFDTSFSGYGLTAEASARVAEIENVCGIKIVRDHAHYLEVASRVGDRILVCEPSETELLTDMRDHGQRVHMSSAAPYLYQTPEWRPMLEYTRAALAGDFDKAAEVAATLAPVREVAEKWLHRRWRSDQVNPIPWLKAWAGLLGMSGGPVRPPLRPPDAGEVAALAADLEHAGLL